YQPHTPENLTVVVLEDKDGTFFRVSWEPPPQGRHPLGLDHARLRAPRQAGRGGEHFAGQQKMFNLFSLRSGGTYLVQVRCKPIHGFWSEWSPPVNVTAPDALTFLILTWILTVKSSR
ncbi:unnamed protein product, partial [Lota lota]